MASGTIISINGVPPKVNFSKCDLTYLDQDKDSYRNANGDLIRNIVNPKRKIELEVPPMRYSKLKQFIEQIRGNSFNVQYHDLSTDTIRNGVFYRGDIKVSIYMDLGNNDYLCNPLSINFIEY